MNAPPNVVGRVSAVLRVVSAHEPSGAGTATIARAAGLARATAHRLLWALLGEGMVDREASTGRWRLGPELYLLGATATSRYDVRSLAQPFVRRLAAATAESAFFSARRGNETVCLLREDGSFPIRSHVLYEGIRLPLGVASAGLAILAYVEEREREAVLAGTDLTAGFGEQHRAELVRERLAATRRVGYAVNPGLIVEGSWGIGAAVFDEGERPQWALSLTGIEQRFGSERRAEMGRLLLRAAHELTLALRRRPGSTQYP